MNRFLEILVNPYVMIVTGVTAMTIGFVMAGASVVTSFGLACFVTIGMYFILDKG